MANVIRVAVAASCSVNFCDGSKGRAVHWMLRCGTRRGQCDMDAVAFGMHGCILSSALTGPWSCSSPFGQQSSQTLSFHGGLVGFIFRTKRKRCGTSCVDVCGVPCLTMGYRVFAGYEWPPAGRDGRERHFCCCCGIRMIRYFFCAKKKRPQNCPRKLEWPDLLFCGTRSCTPVGRRH